MSVKLSPTLAKWGHAVGFAVLAALAGLAVQVAQSGRVDLSWQALAAEAGVAAIGAAASGTARFIQDEEQSGAISPDTAQVATEVVQVAEKVVEKAVAAEADKVTPPQAPKAEAPATPEAAK